MISHLSDWQRQWDVAPDHFCIKGDERIRQKEPISCFSLRKQFGLNPTISDITASTQICTRVIFGAFKCCSMSALSQGLPEVSAFLKCFFFSLPQILPNNASIRDPRLITNRRITDS